MRSLPSHICQVVVVEIIDDKELTMLQYQKKLAKALIYNEHLPKDYDEATPERRSKR